MSDDRMRAITMGAEYAHFVARGVKTVETRGRPCSYRGLVLIHAAAKIHGKPGPIGDYDIEQDAAGYLLRGPIAWPYRLPTAAVVAVADLVDCVPMVHTGEEGAVRTLDVDGDGSLWLVEPQSDEDGAAGVELDQCDMTDQAPYGDYAPGRFALLLANVRRLRSPVPAKGQQAVPWNVPEDVAEKVREQIGEDDRG